MFAVCGVKRVVAVLFLQVGYTVIVVCIEMQVVNLEFVSGTVLKLNYQLKLEGLSYSLSQ